MTADKTTTIAEAVRNLIVCDTQFGWSGETTLKLPELLDLQARGWLIEGDENNEFSLTTAGEAVVGQALHNAARAASPALGQPYQAQVAAWMEQCFLPSLYSDMTERGDRLLEEVLELLQAHAYDSARVATLVNYVYGRPVGDPAQEVGGVMVTLAGYCWVAGLDMHAAGKAELERITQPDVMDKIRRKQEAKNALHFDTPLPGNAALPSSANDLGAGVRAIADERQRQFQAEGFSAESDADYNAGELAKAALAYVQLAAMDLSQGGRDHIAAGTPPACWPWHRLWWKPKNARRDLVRAGALIAAQLDVLDAAAGVGRG